MYLVPNRNNSIALLYCCICTADAVIMDSMVQLQRKEKGGKKEGRTRAGRDDGQKGGGGPDIVGTPTMQALYRDHQKGWRR